MGHWAWHIADTSSLRRCEPWATAPAGVVRKTSHVQGHGSVHHRAAGMGEGGRGGGGTSAEASEELQKKVD